MSQGAPVSPSIIDYRKWCLRFVNPVGELVAFTQTAINVMVAHHTDVQLIAGGPPATLFACGGPPVVHQWLSAANLTLWLPHACHWWSTSGIFAAHSHWWTTGVLLSGQWHLHVIFCNAYKVALRPSICQCNIYLLAQESFLLPCFVRLLSISYLFA